jgi:hypothetical protein
VHEDGQLSVLACLLRRSKSGAVISAGDGYTVYRGVWRAEGGGRIVAHYAKTEEVVPSSAPRQFFEETVVWEKTRLKLGDETFEASNLLSTETYDDFVKPIQRAESANEQQGASVSTAHYFLPRVIDWKAPPEELEKPYDEAAVSILALSASGEYTMIAATVFRFRDTGRIVACGPCGYTTSVGTWSWVSRCETVNLQWRSVAGELVVGEKEREHFQRCDASCADQAATVRKMRCDGIEYEEAGTLEKNEMLEQMIRARD